MRGEVGKVTPKKEMDNRSIFMTLHGLSSNKLAFYISKTKEKESDLMFNSQARAYRFARDIALKNEKAMSVCYHIIENGYGEQKLGS